MAELLKKAVEKEYIISVSEEEFNLIIKGLELLDQKIEESNDFGSINKPYILMQQLVNMK